MPSWDERQYSLFLDARTRPARELLAAVPLAAAERVLDLGCGPGNSTELLRARWPQAHIVGVDSSPDMLRRARELRTDVEWVEADLRTYRPDGPVDLVFSNAVLHWLPEHERLLPDLFDLVRPGGALAFQVPNNFQEPSHRWMRELPGPWRSQVASIRPEAFVGTPAFYYDLLAARASTVDAWQTRYEHVLPDVDAIVEWVKGTGLRPYLEAVSEADRPGYLHAYRHAVASAYPERADGRRLFSFPRLFVVAVRRAG